MYLCTVGVWRARRAVDWYWLAESSKSVMFQAYIRQIPRVNLVGALALGRALLAATNLVPRLSEPILRARHLLEIRLDKLATHTWGHDTHPHAERSPVAFAGRNLDSAWMALHDWLSAISALPAHIDVARTAVELLVKIFPDDVPLVRPPPLLEWAESEARLARMDKSQLETPLREIGGEPFVETIRAAHAHYVEVLGTIESGAWSSRALKQCLDGAVLAIHAYVTCVIAELFDGGPESTHQLSALLGPLDMAPFQRDVRASFFERTLEAFPPPPPEALMSEEVQWEEPYACAV